MKVLLFANTDWYLYNFRLQLAEAVRARGDEVLLLSPPGEYADRLQEKGFRWLPVAMTRRGMNPWAELGAILRLARIYRRERPDIVHHFTVKCVLYGSVAARLARVRAVVNSITGMGYVFLPGGMFKLLLRWFVRAWYRVILRESAVIFENRMDRDTFVDSRLVGPTEAFLTPGAGVDTARFNPQPEPDGPPVALLASRMLWDKGVGEFVQAAQSLRNEGLPARFALAGRTDEGNPASIPAETIAGWQSDGWVEWWGWREDMPSLLQQAAVVCLPSYREGLATVLLEAAAAGRPIVTTDVPGCRDAVEEGTNGLTVPARDAHALAVALKKLLLDPALRQEMGAAGRRLAQDEFSSGIVTGIILSIYDRVFAKD